MAVKMPDLGKMIGPLPLGAWILVVGGGLGFAYYTTRVGSSEPDIVEDVGGTPGVGEGGSGLWTPVGPEFEDEDETEVSITTNEEWGTAVIRHLIAMGYDPGLADAAVRKYLTAEKLSPQEQALINLGMIKYGPPPIPLPPAPPTTNPPPTNDPDGDLAVPTGFDLDGKDWNILLIDWRDVPGAVGYEVRRRGGRDRYGRTAINTITIRSQYRDTNLNKHTVYEYSVRARTVTKVGPWSPWWRTQTAFKG